MKRFTLLTVLATFFLVFTTISANALTIMIGDNDGYGYGDLVVPDGADLPFTDDPVADTGWVFDNRSPAELAATDGSQYTDWEPYSNRTFSFDFAAGTGIISAVFELDVSGIQTSWFGASTILLDGVDYTAFLPTEQGAWGSGVFSTVVDVALLADGVLTVNFTGGPSDHIAFDYFKLDIASVPEPATLLLFGSGLIGLGFFRRKTEIS